MNISKGFSYSSKIYPRNKIQKFDNQFLYYELSALHVEFIKNLTILGIQIPILSQEI